MSDAPTTPLPLRHRIRNIATRVRDAMLPQREPRKRIDLALQGGGAHGAFTWGVLDALLEDGRLYFDAISGTSAGAMNAVVLVDGLRRGGAVGARDQLAKFWKSDQPRGRHARRRRRRARPAARLLAHAEPVALRLFPAVHQSRLALRDQPAQHQSAAGSRREADRLRGGARLRPSAPVHLGDQCPQRQDQGFHRPRDHRQGADRFGLPAVSLPGGGDRRGGLLGRRLHGQPGAVSLLRRLGRAGHPAHPDQSGRAAGGAEDGAAPSWNG